MFDKLLIIGCGLIGSSILKSSLKKKISKQIYIFEKSEKNKKIIKNIDKKIKFINNLNNEISKMDFIIICTPMSEYELIFSKLNQLVSEKLLLQK